METYKIKLVVTLASGEEENRVLSVDAYDFDQAIQTAKMLAMDEDGVVSVEAKIK